MNAKRKFDLFVDNEKYSWDENQISGAQLRVLASIPQGAEVYQKMPGKPDRPILEDTIVDLAASPAPEKFSTQSPGSQAGRC